MVQRQVRPDDIDKIISAELPHPNKDSELFHIVETLMIHGPSGHLNHKSSCMDNQKNVQKDTLGIYTMTLRLEMMDTHYTGGEAQRMEAQQQA